MYPQATRARAGPDPIGLKTWILGGPATRSVDDVDGTAKGSGLPAFMLPPDPVPCGAERLVEPPRLEQATSTLLDYPNPGSGGVVRRAEVEDEHVIVDAPWIVKKDEPRRGRDDAERPPELERAPAIEVVLVQPVRPWRSETPSLETGRPRSGRLTPSATAAAACAPSCVSTRTTCITGDRVGERARTAPAPPPRLPHAPGAERSRHPEGLAPAQRARRAIVAGLCPALATEASADGWLPLETCNQSFLALSFGWCWSRCR
jgi:hypothetical protein